MSIGTGGTQSHELWSRVVDGYLEANISHVYQITSTHLSSVSSCRRTKRKVSSTSIKKRRGAEGVTSSTYKRRTPNTTHHATIACFWRQIRHSSLVVDVCDGPRYRSLVSCVHFRVTYGTVCPSASLYVTCSVVVFGVGMDRWKRSSCSALSTRCDGWEGW